MGLKELIKSSNRTCCLTWNSIVVNHNKEGVNTASDGSLGKEVGLDTLRDCVEVLLYTGSNLH